MEGKKDEKIFWKTTTKSMEKRKSMKIMFLKKKKRPLDLKERNLSEESWMVVECNFDLFIAEELSGQKIAQVNGYQDARLMAAAPELLKILEEGVCSDMTEEWMQRAKTVIRKCYGKRDYD